MVNVIDVFLYDESSSQAKILHVLYSILNEFHHIISIKMFPTELENNGDWIIFSGMQKVPDTWTPFND